ncbi:MAG TPA: hypothetical protein VLV55_02840 [Rhizomicrobium sp.]|nr:hypothetical protein [Rhizomicrobium sp.]
MKFLAAAALTATGSILCGCATVSKGTVQPVAVTTAPVRDAECTLTNALGSWHLKTPGSAMVHQSHSDLAIVCSKPGYADGHAVAEAHFGTETLGNALIGGTAGLIFDASSGADFHYRSPIFVSLVPDGRAPAPRPQQDFAAAARSVSAFPVYLHCTGSTDAAFVADGGPGRVRAKVRFELNASGMPGSVLVTKTDAATCEIGAANGTTILSARSTIDPTRTSIAGVSSADEIAPYVSVVRSAPGADAPVTFTIAAKDDSPGTVTMDFVVAYK